MIEDQNEGVSVYGVKAAGRSENLEEEVVYCEQSFVKMGKWSDIEREGEREESEEVITRSSIWFLLWVGNSEVYMLICWLRLKEDRTDRSWEVRWSVGIFMYILKSPVIGIHEVWLQRWACDVYLGQTHGDFW